MEIVELLILTGVIPSGGPRHWKVAVEPPAEHTRVYASPAVGEPEGVDIETPPTNTIISVIVNIQLYKHSLTNNINTHCLVVAIVISYLTTELSGWRHRDTRSI